MYCDYFGLRFRPFDDRADTRFFFATSECEETLAALEYESLYGRGLALLLGEAGTGKTLLIRMLLQRLRTPDHVVVLTWPAGGRGDLMRETSKGFGVSLPSSPSDARFLARFRRHLTRVANEGHRSILIIDQSENLAARHLEQLAALMELQHSGQKLLSIILSGQPVFRMLLERPELARIRQQLFGERVLPPLTLEETTAYVRHRLQIAGAVETALFDQEAVERIHTASGGIPRLINHICNAAMLASYGAGKRGVDRDMVAEVSTSREEAERTVQARELGLTSAEEVAAGWTAASPPDVSPATTPAPGGEPSGATLEDVPTRHQAAAGAMSTPPGSDGGAAIALTDRSRSGPPSAPDASALQSGEALLHRLERALARAERINATTEASLSQQAAVEKHLLSLTTGAERLVGHLAEAAGHATECFENVRGRADRLIDEAETRLNTMDARLVRVSDVSKNADEQVSRVERACTQAGDARTQLAEFTEQLTVKADETQGRLTALTEVLQASESARGRLDDLLKQESDASAQAQEHVDRLRAAMKQTSNETQQIRQKVVETVEARCRETLRKQMEDCERSLLERTDEVQRKLDGIGARVSAVTTEAEKAVHRLRGILEESRREGDVFQKRFTVSALRVCREKLERQLEEHLRQQEEAAGKALQDHGQRLKVVLDEAESRSRALEEHTKNSREQTDHTLASCHKALTEILESIEDRVRRQRTQIRTVEQQQETVGASLETLSEHLGGAAERVSRLSETVQHVSGSVEELAGRASSARTHLAEILPEGDQLLRDLQGCCGQASAMRQNATAVLVEAGGACERLAGLRDQVAEYERLVARLTNGREEGEKTAGELESLVAAAKQSLHQAQTLVTTAAQHVERFESQRSDATSLLDALTQTNEAGRRLAERVAESIRRAEHAAETAHDQADELTTLQSTGKTTAQGLEELVASAGQLHEALHDVMAQADGKIDRLDSSGAAVHRALHDLSEASEATRRLLEEVNRSVQSASEAMDQSAQQTARLIDAKAGGEAVAAQLEPLVESAGPWPDAIERAVADADDRVKRLESHDAAAGQTLERLKDATRTGRQLVERMDDSARRTEHTLDRTAQQLTRVVGLQKAGETIASQLEPLVESAKELPDAIQTAVAGAEQTIGRLDAHDARMARVLDNLTDATAAGRQTAERVAEVSQKAEEVVDRAASQVTRLTSARDAGETVTGTLDALLASAKELQEGIQSLAAHADEKIRQLDSHDAHATHVIRQLADASTESRAVIEQVNESTAAVKKAAEEARAGVERHIQDVRSLAATSEVGAKALGAGNAKAQELMEQLKAATGPAERIGTELACNLELAKTRAGAIAERCTEARQLADRLSTLARTAEEAKQAEESIQRTAQDAQTVRRQVAEVTETATTRCADLIEHSTAAQTLIDLIDRLKSETERAGERLEAQLSATQKSVELSEPLIQDWTTQTRALERRLLDLESTAREIDRRLGEMTAKPADIVKRAQAQTARLETICTAVRKIVGNLSRASLEAREHTVESKRTSQEATQRLAQLNAETDRAAKTLHEWVSEALGVQSRLERTLQLCPTIHETHPGDTLRRLKQVVLPPAPMAPSAAAGELSMLDEPAPLKSEDNAQAQQPRTRAEEIARLIEDAKRATASSTP